MDQLIPLINKLQDVFAVINQSPIALPQLVVVGSQSSGKSSVLEHIVGRDFLPRGAGIVTRRPLILQLINTRTDTVADDDDEEDNDDDDINIDESHVTDRRRTYDDSNGHDDNDGDKENARRYESAAKVNGVNVVEWGEFLHRPNQRFIEFNAIRAEIDAETERILGSHKGVSADPIRLTLYSPNVLSLTLVDLPGLTKVPVGDQPANIQAQIREIVLHYIGNPNSIIIAVSPANSDIANSDSLQIAREVDPKGRRTLGVITKLDLMDRGTDAMQLLIGNVIPLQLGFIGVVNRGQADINDRKTIQQALAAEKMFFITHPVYRSIANRMGTSYLAKRLNSILMAHIQTCLPDLRAKIGATMAEAQAELDSYGTPLSGGSMSMGTILLPIISKFATNYVDALDGKSADISLNELYGGARISFVFRELFSVAIQNIQPFVHLSDADIRTAIRNASGPRPALFIPEVSFELLVKKQIERLLTPSLDCVDLVYHELQIVCKQSEVLTPQLNRFPRLKSRMMEVVNELLKNKLDPTKHVIHNLLQCELAYINTNHPDFIGGSTAVASIMQQTQHNKDESAALTISAAANAGPRRHDTTADNNTQTHKHHDTAVTPPMTAASTANGTATPPVAQIVQPSAVATATTAIAATAANAASASRSGILSMFFGGGTQPPPPTTAESVRAAAAVTSNTVQSTRLQPLSENYSQHLQSLAPTDRELIETAVIKTLIQSYYNIVRKNICDLIPKAIMAFLVNQSKAELQSELVRSLYKPTLFDSLMREADDISVKRAACEELIGILDRAMQIVNQARDFQTSNT